MPRPTLTLTLIGLILSTVRPPPARAQEKDAVCRNIQNRPLHVGQWASYAWSGGRSDGSALRLAVVGSEPHDGTTYYWYEIALTDPHQGAAGRSVFQLLVADLGYRASGVRGVIMKRGAEPAMRMPDAMVRLMGSQVGTSVAGEIARVCQGMDLVGSEPVTVPAGTFRALHLRNPQERTEAWIKLDLEFAVVKLVTQDGGIMALTGMGGGAKSSITEEPRELGSPP
jgi:hypothetical protein